MDKIMNMFKAWAGLIGAAFTAVSAIGGMPLWVTVVGVAATAVAVYGVPNRPMPGEAIEGGYYGPDSRPL